LSAIFKFLFISFKRKNISVLKQKVVKKDELIESYKIELQDILERYEDNKELQMQERIKFLKRVNYELSMNIFFDENEAKELLQELSKLGK
ncbi:MAG: hypothetical protein AB7I39_06215, partial [Arcobacter sp.]